MKHIAILFALLISAFLSVNLLLAQDSTRIQIPDSVRYAAFDTNVIISTNRLSNTSEVFSYNEYIWSDKRNLTEIMEMRNGFRGYNQGLGLFNSFYEYMFRGMQVPIYRDGFEMYTYDSENISINEIDSIEIISSVSSYLYSDSYTTGAINVLSKDIIQPKPFSQLRYSQDRHNALFADVYFSQSFSRKFNMQLGLTKGSNDGRYANSSYDKWQTRTKLNFFFNPNFNIRTSFYFNKIERGLFGGLLSDTSNTVVNDSLRAIYTNIFFNTGFYFKFFRNKNNLTKLDFTYTNSKREIINGFFSNSLDKIYEINLNQNFNIDISNDIKSNLILNGNYEYGKHEDEFKRTIYSGFAKYDVNYKNLFVSGFYKYGKNESSNRHSSPVVFTYSSPGIEARYKLLDSKDLKINIFGGMNYSGISDSSPNIFPFNYYNNEIGFNLAYKNIFSKFKYRRGVSFERIRLAIDSTFEYRDASYTYDSYNMRLKFKLLDMVFDLIDDYYIYADINLNLFRANIFYENKFFNDNLDLKTGFIVKHYDNLVFYNYRTNPPTVIISNLSNVDFYVGARIGSANVNFTLANLFNRFNYDTYLYPYDDRGGFGNVVSRFTIVWDFLN
jgi:hypothetical protein